MCCCYYYYKMNLYTTQLLKHSKQVKMVVDEFSIKCLVVSVLVRLQIIMSLTHHECGQVCGFIYRHENRENDVCVHGHVLHLLTHTTAVQIPGDTHSHHLYFSPSFMFIYNHHNMGIKW